MSFRFPRRCTEREDHRFVPPPTSNHSPRHFSVPVYKESHLQRENPRFPSSTRENDTGISAVTWEALWRSRKYITVACRNLQDYDFYVHWYLLKRARLTSHVMWANPTKFDLHTCNMNFSIRNGERISLGLRIIICVILLCIFICIACNKNADIAGKIYIEMSLNIV